jgi:protein-L-isoaspartate(D-aspartate) O-methyltransferase
MRTFLMTALLTLCFTAVSRSQEEDPYFPLRQRMVEDQIRSREVNDPRVLAAMLKVRRHLFVPKDLVELSYADYPLAIGHGQTISQPYIVAFMTELLGLKGQERVLEIGTGSGYQAAVLAEIAQEVYSVEIIKELALKAEQRLADLCYRNIHVKQGDGYKGWSEHAPFDAIIVTAAPPDIPQELVAQLKVGGRMVIPVGSFFQDLYVITKTAQGVIEKNVLPVRFVPMIKGKEKVSPQ